MMRNESVCLYGGSLVYYLHAVMYYWSIRELEGEACPKELTLQSERGMGKLEQRIERQVCAYMAVMIHGGKPNHMVCFFSVHGVLIINK